MEPHCVGVSALHSPVTGIVDFADVAGALADDLTEHNVPVATGAAVRAIDRSNGRLALGHAGGEVRARFAVFAAGAAADRLAVLARAPADPRIIPFAAATWSCPSA